MRAAVSSFLFARHRPLSHSRVFSSCMITCRNHIIISVYAYIISIQGG